MSVLSGPVPVWVMIHWSVDKTFLAGVAVGILSSATSAVILFFDVLKVLMRSHPEASLLLVFLLCKPTGSAQN